MRPFRVWKMLLGLGRTVIEEIEVDERDGALVVSVRPRAGERDRCPHCRRRCPGYDQGTAAGGGGRSISLPRFATWRRGRRA